MSMSMNMRRELELRGLDEGLPLKRRQMRGAIRLFRYWRVVGRLLFSTVVDHVWQEYNQSPLDNLGFHGFKSYGDLLAQEGDMLRIEWSEPSHVGSGYAAGTILCWGTVITAEFGARAQFAKLESLIEPPNTDNAIRMLDVADTYGLRIMSEDTAHQLRGGLVPYRWGEDDNF